MDIELIIVDAEHASCEPIVRSAIMGAARVMGVENATAEVSIVGDAFMQKNVLAYPASGDFPRPDLDGKRDLGEMYLNPGYIKAHGEDLRFMAVHGFLHLLGYDHGGDNDTLIMEAKEREIAAALAEEAS